MNGHPVDKIELLVLGGTWTSYPHKYQETFIRDLFYAANTFWQRPKDKRLPVNLDEEKALNESARVKIIGITLETRPDCIDKEELWRLRRYGCTRVQIGMQHTDDAVLKKINRGCTHKDMVDATRLLKDSCYKLDVHIMPNLPGSNLEMDRQMFDEMMTHPDLQVDQWKIYPCEIVPWTVIKRWFENGEYVPYCDEDLVSLLLDVLPRIPHWVRVNRIVRDIPSQYILTGLDRPNLRQDMDTYMFENKILCQDIRAREVKGQCGLEAELVVRSYQSSGGVDHFISFESLDGSTIMAFCRLRLSNDPGGGVFKELEHAALIRELHVYGQLTVVTALEKEGDSEKGKQQHVGFGFRLMQHAEIMACRDPNVTKVAVISGVGVRNYYRRLGYHLDEGRGEFMVKDLTRLHCFRYGVLWRLQSFMNTHTALVFVVPVIAFLMFYIRPTWSQVVIP